MSDSQNLLFAPETDRKGCQLQPGDHVRFKLYPRGSAFGVVVISERSRVVVGDNTLPALAIDCDGTVYALVSKGTTKVVKP